MFAGFNTVYFDILLQFIVVALLILALVQASGNSYEKHCRFIGIAVLVQLVSIVAFMLPSMNTLSSVNMSGYFTYLMYFHHLLGLLVIIFSIYIKLAFSGKIPSVVAPLKMMKLTLVLWILTFMGGLILYLTLWQGITII